jgi:hypothetical protein
MPAIPERQPIADPFTGMVLRLDQTHLLARTPQPGTEVVASGDLVVRYGIQYLDKPHLAIVPGLVALDYGEIITGDEAWDFCSIAAICTPALMWSAIATMARMR